jgi:hypothetical protein
MSTPTPPVLQYVRGFKDEPTVKVIDASNQAERDTFRTYMLDVIAPSMYIHGDNEEPAPTAAYPLRVVGNKFLDDTETVIALMRESPVTVDAAALNNSSWHYCYLNNPSVSVEKNINLLILSGQRYSVTNTGTVPIWVYIRRYDSAGKMHIGRHTLIAAGERARF